MFLPLVALLLATLWAGCGDDDPVAPETPPLAKLEILSLSPQSIEIVESTTITLTGSGFTETTVVSFNGRDLETHFVSPDSIDARIPADYLLTTQRVPIAALETSSPHGTSNVVYLEVLSPLPSPVPTIQFFVPSTIESGIPGTILSIRGTNFTPETRVLVNGGERASEWIDDRQLRTFLNADDVESAGTLLVQVDNPGPGGGVAESAVEVVDPPGPLTLISIQPPELPRGEPRTTLRLIGTGFRPWTTVFFDEVRTVPQFVSPETLLVTIVSRTSHAAEYAVTVRHSDENEGNSIPFVITGTNPVPAPTLITPTWIHPDATTTTVRVEGTGFTWRSQIYLDGLPIETDYSSGTGNLSFSLTGDDIPEEGNYNVTVNNDETPSGSITAGTLIVHRPLDYITEDLCFDATRNRLYAAASGSFADGVLVIDPDTWTVEHVHEVGTGVGPLSITEDGRYLYAGFVEEPLLRRFDLESEQVDLVVNLTTDVRAEPAFAAQIVPLPGNPRSFAVVPKRTSNSNGDGMLVFDDDAQRPLTIGGFGDPRISSLVIEPSGTRAYGANRGISSNDLTVVAVTNEGAEIVEIHRGLIEAYGGELLLSGDRLYTSPGPIIDTDSFHRVGNFQGAYSRHTPVEAEGLIFMMEYGGADRPELVGYDPQSFLAKRRIAIGRVDDAITAFAYLGNSRFAIATESRIFRIEVP